MMGTDIAIRDEKKVYGKIVRLTLPIVVQNLLSALVSSADVVMLTEEGQSAISAVSLAAQYTNLLFMVFYGLGTGISMLASQYWGKRDIRAVELVQGIALRFSVLAACAFFLCAQLAPQWVMRMFTDEEELIVLGVAYLRAGSWSYLFWSVSDVYLSTLRSVGRVTVSTVLSTVALVLNVALNAVFVFALGMGVAGVGWATSISRGIALMACAAVSMRSGDVKMHLHLMFARSADLLRDFVKMAIPALLNDVVWSVGFTMYSVILGHLGSDAVSANAVVVVIRNFATVMCYAFGSASTIWLGQLIGSGHMEYARKDATRLIYLTVASSIAGSVLIALSYPIAMVYARDFAHLTETATHYLSVMILINIVYVWGTAINTIFIAGIFRAGGDSRFGFVCDTVDMWAYAVPLGMLAAFVVKLPPLWVYVLICTDEFVKWPWVFKHYKSMRWLKNITRASYE